MRERSKLIARIHATNDRSKLADGRSMTEVLAQRDELAQHHKLLQAAIAATNQEVDRYSIREIKWVPVVDVKGLQKQIEDLAVKLRELNVCIQQANWSIDLDD